LHPELIIYFRRPECELAANFVNENVEREIPMQARNAVVVKINLSDRFEAATAASLPPG